MNEDTLSPPGPSRTAGGLLPLRLAEARCGASVCLDEPVLGGKKPLGMRLRVT